MENREVMTVGTIRTSVPDNPPIKSLSGDLIIDEVIDDLREFCSDEPTKYLLSDWLSVSAGDVAK